MSSTEYERTPVAGEFETIRYDHAAPIAIDGTFVLSIQRSILLLRHEWPTIRNLPMRKINDLASLRGLFLRLALEAEEEPGTEVVDESCCRKGRDGIQKCSV